jgi:uncharacterized protein (DUF433 family)
MTGEIEELSASRNGLLYDLDAANPSPGEPENGFFTGFTCSSLAQGSGCNGRSDDDQPGGALVFFCQAHNIVNEALVMSGAQGQRTGRRQFMTWQERIVIDPEILVGKPIVKGTRLAVEFLVDLLAHGWTEEDIRTNYPGLTHEDIQACLSYASAVLRSERVYPLQV